MTRLVMKLKQMVGAEGKSSVRPTIVIAEFDIVHTGGESLEHRADLAAQRGVAWKSRLGEACRQPSNPVALAADLQHPSLQALLNLLVNGPQAKPRTRPSRQPEAPPARHADTC